MKEIRLYNTLTRKKEAFEPIDSNNVRVYACGPTVYDRIHVGNARPLVVFDVLVRLLRHRYGEDKVKYVRNITDVDDKINARASEEGVSIEALTEKTIADFKADCSDLNLLEPDKQPQATKHIEEMKKMIETLIDKGHAYEAEGEGKGHVLFSVASKADYGCLSGRNREEQIAGARVEVAEFKRDAGDFVLWKPSDKSQPGWDSPWGRGRPGWHIECSAMSAKYLGEVFDIHAGGQDLIFPHHENEIAQSCAAHGTERMANFWLHNGYVTSKGEKMAKSEGNFVTLRNALIHNYGGVIRYALLAAQYRQPLDFSEENLSEIKQSFINLCDPILTQKIDKKGEKRGEIDQEILNALSDDLNTPKALARLHEIAHEVNEGDSDAELCLKISGKLLGLFKWLEASNTYQAYYDRGEAKVKLDLFEEALSDYNEAIRLKPDFTEAYYYRGVVKFTLGQHKKAISDFDEVIRLNPDDANAYHIRRAIKNNLGLHKEVVSDFDEFIRLNPDDAEAYNNRGEAKEKLGQYKEAINDYGEAIRLKPDYVDAYNNRGNAKYELEQYEEAISDYDKSIHLDPDYAVAYYNLGLVKRDLGRHEEAISDFNEAARLDPNDPETYYNRGLAKGRLGQHEEEISDYDEVIRLNSDHAEAYYYRGITKAQLGRYEEAINDFNEFIRLNPDYAEAYYTRGLAKGELGLGQHEEAIKDYDEALSLKPDHVKVYMSRAFSRSKLKRHEEAISDYNEAIRLKPDDAVIYFNRGVMKDELGQYKEAISDYDESIRLNPNDAEVYYNRGGAKSNLRQYEEAIKDYDDAIRLNPDFARAYFNRGNARSNLEQYEEAVSDYDEVTRLKPDFAEAYVNRGVKKGILGQYEEALGDFEEAIRLKPDYAEAYYARGSAKEELGLDEEAVSDYNEALSLKPDLAELYEKDNLYKSDKILEMQEKYTPQLNGKRATKAVRKVASEFSKNMLSEEELNQYIEEREEARKKGDFEKADKIRDMLEKTYAITLEDTPEGPKWRIKSKSHSFFDN